MSDQTPAEKKTTPDEMTQIRRTGLTTTDVPIPVGRVNSMYVVANAACWLKFDNESGSFEFTKIDGATTEFKHPGGGASFPIIQNDEATHLHCEAESGTVDIEIYPGQVTNAS